MKTCPVLLALLAPVALLAQGVDRAHPPTLPPPPTLRVPVAQTATLPNGLELVVVEKHEVPVVDVQLTVGAGSVRDPDSVPGLATFTAAMLQQGAGTRGALDIADQIAYLGADFSTSATYDYADVSLHVPKRQLADALDLMADVVLRPTFPDSEIARERQQRRTNILQYRDNPVTQATLAFSAIVYGMQHPYGRPLNGTAASTELLSAARVRAFYGQYYRPNNARLLIVGDVTLAEARRMIGARFGAWQRGAIPPLPAATPPAPVARAIYLVDKPGAAQSVIRIGQVGIARSSADYAGVQVLNTLLGGSFTSRLNQNLRETHAFTYGAGSAFAARRLAGPFIAQASVVTAKTDSSLIEFMRELRRIREEPVPADELAKAKAYITLGLPGDFETTAGTSGEFLDLVVNDLPLTWFAGYIRAVNAVTAADVQRLAQQYIDVDHLDIVVVGDRSQIEAGLRAVNEGPIELRDLWGAPVQ